MFFSVVAGRVTSSEPNRAYLIKDNWDDWFEFETLFLLEVFNAAAVRIEIGPVKIGQFGMRAPQRSPELPASFERADERFFSLGQRESYYEALGSIEPELRDRVLEGLRDISFNLDLFATALSERVCEISLLRSIKEETVKGRFHRLAMGNAELTPFHFEYQAPAERNSVTPLTLTFDVEPQSQPPTNVHILIGRNGVGKTTCLNRITRFLVQEADTAFVGEIRSIGDQDRHGSAMFANVVSVTFSAFDPFGPIPDEKDRRHKTRYAYIGLKAAWMPETSQPLPRSEDERPAKSPAELTADFVESAMICRRGVLGARWRSVLETLEADPLFKEANVSELSTTEDSEFAATASKLFRRLSSGHKIVLLAATRLVETVEERTLVLLDEPEAHLHPPLLAALVRALSELLAQRNGAAIIATHSPVVLQEVPRSCVWILRRSGLEVRAERPHLETFGENAGILTREVFGLEVTQSGFHKLLADAANELDTYEELLERFNGQLGAEARAIARALVACRKDDGDAS